jgi:hypothetical protein
VSADTLKNCPDRFVLPAVPVAGIEIAGDWTAYFVPKAAPEAAVVVPVLTLALDRGQHILVRTAPDDPTRIVEARLDDSHQWAYFECPDRPEMTPSFWASKEAVPEPPVDHVRWVATQPACSSRLVTFYTAAAVRWIHPAHPRAQHMLEVARRSIDEDLEVQPFLCSGAENFLADLTPVR